MYLSFCFLFAQVTNATACAVPSPNVTVVSKGNTGDLIATGTPEGKVNIWRFDCGLKLVKFIHLSPYDSIFSGILATDSNKVWSASLEKDTCKFFIPLLYTKVVASNISIILRLLSLNFNDAASKFSVMDRCCS